MANSNTETAPEPLAQIGAKAEVLPPTEIAELDEQSKRVITEIEKIAFGDIRDLLDDKGNLLPKEQWSESAAAAVAAIEVEEIFQGRGEDRQQVGIVRKIKRWDKPKALEMLGRHKSLFHDKSTVEHTGTITHETRFVFEAIGKEPEVEGLIIEQKPVP